MYWAWSLFIQNINYECGDVNRGGMKNLMLKAVNASSVKMMGGVHSTALLLK